MQINRNANKHLTLEERRIILHGIEAGSKKSSIADTIGKDKSTVGKEIKLHRILKHKCPMPLECSNYKRCAYGRNCTTDCPEYHPFSCSRRDRSPGACNGCAKYSTCRFNKYYYVPEDAQQEYNETLVGARVGVNLTVSEAKQIAGIIEPLLKKGQSPYSILQNHPELPICEKTLYNYIEGGVFENISDISVMDLRRQVSRKITKKKSEQYKKRQDKKYLQGRTYKDFCAYKDDFPNLSIVQMDTVYNDEINGPFMQTFKFVDCGVLFAVYQTAKTALSMTDGVDLLEQILGRETFQKYVSVILTDRGSEFSDADGMEIRPDKTIRTRVFYCDPMRSNQKGSLENKHIELRYICPKSFDLFQLGLTGQTALNLVLSHCNSSPCEKSGGKSPLEICEFLYPDLYQKLCDFGIRKIPKDEITLNRNLLKSIR